MKIVSVAVVDEDYDYGCNPCSEIILRSKQFCNLSEVVIRPSDTLLDLKRKVELATILGTLQSTLTNFRYLSREWKKNTEEERLLGVSLTGIMDHPVLSGEAKWCDTTERLGHFVGVREMSVHRFGLPEVLEELKEVAIVTNKRWAEALGIEASAGITCVKPSGTVSQLVDSSSGIHARYAPYYIRTVRNNKVDPISELLVKAGVPHEESEHDPGTWVFSFPMKAPEGATVTKNVPALDQLKLWQIYDKHWCEHKPSITVFYKDSEFLDVGAWVYNNFDEISGISFLPQNDHVYKQAPYQEISKEQYETTLAKFPKNIPWDSLHLFEKEDNTTATHELACTSGGCEV